MSQRGPQSVNNRAWKTKRCPMPEDPRVLQPASRNARLRKFYASFVASRADAHDPRIEQAFAVIPREPFAGPPPWSIGTRGQRYVETPDADPAYLYQDVLVALDRARGINIGEPSLHALCLDALSPQPGETVLQVGAGSGYYSALLGHLVGPTGHVHTFEIDQTLAARARENLAPWPWIVVEPRSGTLEGLPKADAIYVNAGITQPAWAWLDALRAGGRLLFPLQPEHGFGGMLLVKVPNEGGLRWPARFVSRAGFIACQGHQVAETGRGLAAAFAAGGWEHVRSICLDSKINDTCWFNGGDWWLSTASP